MNNPPTPQRSDSSKPSAALMWPQLLADLGRSASSSKDSLALFRQAIQQVRQATRATYCAVLELRPSADAWTLGAASDQSDAPDAIKISAATFDLIGRALAAGATLLGADIVASDGAPGLTYLWTKDALVAPIAGPEHPFGLLISCGAPDRVFSDVAAANIQAVAALLGGAVVRIAAEQQAQNATHARNLLLSHTTDAILTVDADGVIHEANPAACNMFKYQREELINANIDLLLPSQDGTALLNSLFAATGNSATPLKRTALGNKGLFLQVEVAVALLAPERLLVIISYSGTQLGGRQESEQDEDVFFKAFHASAAAMAITHFSGVYIDANESCLQLMGLPREDVIGHTGLELNFWSDPTQRQAVGRLLAEHGQASNIEIQGRSSNGAILDLLASFVLLTINGDLCVVTSFMDMTELKRAAEANRARAAAEEASRAKSEFLSRMSHELRTPLNAILGFAQLMQLSDQTPANFESIVHILTSGRHLLQLVNEALDIVSIEQGDARLRIEPIRLNEVIEEALYTALPLAQQAGVSLHKEARLDCNCIVSADRARLTQVLLHLLTNAINFNRPGGKVTLRCAAMGNGCVRLTVSDTGRGIAPDHLHRLFMPFERLGAERTEVEGTGLGLVLSQRVLEAMGSRIEVSSVEGVGSSFWFELPVSASDQAAPSAGAADAASATILYVENDSDHVKLVARIVARWSGVGLLLANSGSQALELLQSQRPTLILLNLNLPNRDGYDLLRRLRAEPNSGDAPIVALISSASDAEQRRIVRNGATACLNIPLDVPEFMRVVGGLVGQAVT